MLKQPVGQKKLTNIALIKYKVSKKNFEIAAYRNMAIDFRNGIQKNLNEVLQMHTIYTNASQGEQASQEELERYFPKMKYDDIIRTILEKGELQISDKEREAQIEMMFKDVANIIAEKCCHPDSKRPFSLESIKSALKTIHFSPKLDQPVKKQASDCIKKLREMFYITRAEMKIKLTVPNTNKARMLEELEILQVKPSETIMTKDNTVFICLIEPSLYRPIDEAVKKKIGVGTMEIAEQYVMNKEVADLENAGVVNLQMREKPIKIEESDSEDEGKKKHKDKGKKAKDEKKEKEAEHKEKKEEGPQAVEKENGHPKEEVKAEDKEKKFKCTSCKDAAFETNLEFKAHFKTDWHNFNLKRKVEKKPLLNEAEYLDQLLDGTLETSTKAK